MSATKQYNRKQGNSIHGARDYYQQPGEPFARQDAGLHSGPQHLLSGIDTAPITKQLPPPSRDLEKVIESPWLPRATVAPTLEHPRGSPEREHVKDKTVMQQHVDFFDLNGDGWLTMLETYQSFRLLGYNVVSSIAAMFVINFSFSFFTQDSWIPDPYFRVNLKNIHGGKHGSDTGVYDKQGRYIPAKYESIFSEFDKTDKKGLSPRDIWHMWCITKNPFDAFGWFAFMFEWSFTWFLVADVDNNILHKEDIRRVYDGTIFYAIAEDRKTGGKQYGKKGLSFSRGVTGAFRYLFAWITGADTTRVTSRVSDKLSGVTDKLSHAGSTVSHSLNQAQQQITSAIKQH